MDERRGQPRMRRLKEARIVFNGNKSVLSCVVRDATAEGARVTVGEPYLIPFEFDFVVGSGPARHARKVWVRQNQMGLKFIG